MNAATITALCTGITGIIGAATALVRVFTHSHDDPPQGPIAK